MYRVNVPRLCPDPRNVSVRSNAEWLHRLVQGWGGGGRPASGELPRLAGGGAYVGGGALAAVDEDTETSGLDGGLPAGANVELAQDR
jgi:hypothetical protein